MLMIQLTSLVCFVVGAFKRLGRYVLGVFECHNSCFAQFKTRLADGVGDVQSSLHALDVQCSELCQKFTDGRGQDKQQISCGGWADKHKQWPATASMH